MQKESLFFQILRDEFNHFAKHPWMTAQLKYHPVLNLTRKELSQKLIDVLFPLFGVSETLSQYTGLHPLYEGVQSLNLKYFRKEEVRRMFEKCFGLSDIQRQQLTESITIFLEIVEKTDLNPEQLKTVEILELWWQVFPESQTWTALRWLWRQGVFVPSSQAGCRAWWRFTRGTLPEVEKNGYSHPRKWCEICEKQTTFDSAFEADRMAAAFSGEGKDVELQGVCGVIPDCENCALNSECLWNAEGGNFGKSGIEEKIQKKQISEDDVPELLQWLLSTNSEEAKALRDILNEDAPLKDWDRDRLRKLENQLPLSSGLIPRLEALHELCRYYGMEKLKPRKQYHSSRDIFCHFHEQLEGQKQEQFIIVLLDNKHRYLAEQDITKGILNKSLVHPREVFASAIEYRAAALVCVHNHPSGDPEPSEEDLRITERLVEVGKLVGIPVLDHVVIGSGRYTSFADEGLL